MADTEDITAILDRQGVKVLTASETKSERGQISLSSRAGWDSILESWGNAPGDRQKIPSRPEQVIRQYRSWTYVCANKNATAVAAVPVRLYYKRKRRGQRMLFAHRALSVYQLKWLESHEAYRRALEQSDEVVEITEHPLLDLLRTVNDDWNYFDAMELTQTFVELCGMAFWALDLNGGQPASFNVLPSHHVKVLFDRRTGRITGYQLGYPPNAIRFDPEEVIFFRQPSPLHQILGYGPAYAAFGVTDTQNVVENYTDNIFENNAVPPAVMVPEQPLTKDQAQELREDWNTKYAGWRKAGKLPLAPFKVTLQTVAANAGLLARLADRDVAKSEIAAAFGVSLSKLENKADASGVQGDITYLRDTILPRCRRIEGVWNAKLTPLYDEGLFLAFDNPVPVDREYELRRGAAMAQVDGAIYVNEIRSAMGLDPLPEFDGLLYERNIGVASAPAGADSGLVRTARKSVVCSHSFLGDRADVKALDRKLLGVLRDLFGRQREAVLEALPKSARAAKAVSDGFDIEEWTQRFMASTREYLERDLVRGAEQGAARIGASIAFDISRPEIQEFIHGYVYRFSRSVNETTQQALREVFQSALAEGQTYRDMADGVEAVFDNASRYRSLMIARTEGSRAMNAGTVEAWRASGQVRGYAWDAEPTACEFCAALAMEFSEDNPMEIGKNFAVLGQTLTGTAEGTMRVTYANVGHPPLHPHCICTLAPVLIGD